MGGIRREGGAVEEGEGDEVCKVREKRRKKGGKGEEGDKMGGKGKKG